MFRHGFQRFGLGGARRDLGFYSRWISVRPFVTTFCLLIETPAWDSGLSEAPNNSLLGMLLCIDSSVDR